VTAVLSVAAVITAVLNLAVKEIALPSLAALVLPAAGAAVVAARQRPRIAVPR
jgi:hypothetical protein